MLTYKEIVSDSHGFYQSNEKKTFTFLVHAEKNNQLFPILVVFDMETKNILLGVYEGEKQLDSQFLLSLSEKELIHMQYTVITNILPFMEKHLGILDKKNTKFGLLNQLSDKPYTLLTLKEIEEYLI